jgi:dTDP-4-amino-4,6-dideoxygalactose transaminase
LFFIKTKDATERENLIKYLNNKTVNPAFHYLPLHTSKAGKASGRFDGTDTWTTKESERLLRLPMFYNLKPQEIAEITAIIKRFYETKT